MPYFGFNPNGNSEYLRYKSARQGIPGLEEIPGGREPIFDQLFAGTPLDRFEKSQPSEEIVFKYPKADNIVIRYPKSSPVASPLGALSNEVTPRDIRGAKKVLAALQGLEKHPAQSLGYEESAF